MMRCFEQQQQQIAADAVAVDNNEITLIEFDNRNSTNDDEASSDVRNLLGSFMEIAIERHGGAGSIVKSNNNNLNNHLNLRGQIDQVVAVNSMLNSELDNANYCLQQLQRQLVMIIVCFFENCLYYYYYYY